MAFLDVMACGLGATILLFLIVKRHVELMPRPVAAEQPAMAADDTAVAALRRDAALLTARIAEARRQSRERRVRATRAAADRTRLAALKRDITQAETVHESLRREVESIEPAQARDVVEESRKGEEQYLLGLKVEGRRIAILLDRSASMTDHRLIDIISRKVGTDAEKRKGPKWRRALRTVRWLLHRLPEQSKVAVTAFNDRASALHGGGWADGRDAATLKALFAELYELVPTGATNLESGLQKIGELSPAVTDLYVVTDGLPTQRSASSGLFGGGCGGKSATRISGACRKKLFHASLRHSAPAGAKVHVILLPLEGDPEAAPSYWRWTALAGGMLLAPAAGWP